jgi:hypothetical protein
MRPGPMLLTQLNGDIAGSHRGPNFVIPGRARSGRTRNLEIPGSTLRAAPE